MGLKEKVIESTSVPVLIQVLDSLRVILCDLGSLQCGRPMMVVGLETISKFIWYLALLFLEQCLLDRFQEGFSLQLGQDLYGWLDRSCQCLPAGTDQTQT